MICPCIFQILTNCRFDLFLHFQMLPKSDSNSKVDFLFCQIDHVLLYQLQLIRVFKLMQPIRMDLQLYWPMRRRGCLRQFEKLPEIYCIIILLDSVFPLPDSPVIKMHFHLVFMMSQMWLVCITHTVWLIDVTYGPVPDLLETFS